MDQNGKVKWISSIDPDCPKSDNIYLTVKACQESPPDRCSEISLAIRILGIQNEPKFTKVGYHADKLKLGAKPGDDLVIIEGKIEATISDNLETKTVLYKIDKIENSGKLF